MWAWDPVPPGSPAFPGASGVAYRRGTANAWTPFSVDAALGLVYVPTGNTSPDYYGGERDGLDFYSSSIVALDGRTGQVRWHFRAVHHDVWDYDTPAQPVFADFPKNGVAVPALIQATKMGHLFFLDRRSGEPLLPVEERPVPQGGVPGEKLSPTQPFPLRPAPLHPATLTPDDAFGFTPWDRAECREAIAVAALGGHLHAAVALRLDPVPGHGRRVELGQRQRRRRSRRVRDQHDAARHVHPARAARRVRGAVPGRTARVRLRAAGRLALRAAASLPGVVVRSAVQSAAVGHARGGRRGHGELRWEVPLGTARDLAPFPVWLFAPEGVPNIGGPITTASGLTFIGATTDRYLRAFSTETGEELWRARLPTTAHATPMTYRLREDGRQFVVIAAGGHGLIPSEPGDALIAFALP